MRHARENFDKVIDLQSKKKNRRTDDSVKYFNLNCECSHDPKGQTFFLSYNDKGRKGKYDHFGGFKVQTIINNYSINNT